jgi:hypothetical protein
MAYTDIVFLAVWKDFNPFRLVLIILVSLLWLLCFSGLFSKDKRKMRVGYRGVFKAKLLKFGFTEKRKHPRITFPMAIKFRVLAPGAPAAEVVYSTANAKNLSREGILINTADDVPAGADIEIKLNVHGIENPITVIGSVTRKEKDTIENTYSLGVLFKKLETIDKAELVSFIAQNL